MRCPQCKEQTLKEDYSKKDKKGNFIGDDLYCPQCGFTESRAILDKLTPTAPRNTEQQLVVCPEQIRQSKAGCVISGSVPYRVVARDWIFVSKWIVQDLFGGLRRVEESEITKDPFMDEPNASAVPSQQSGGEQKQIVGGFSVGDFVSPKTAAGLELADVFVNGQYAQDRKVVCVFVGVGVVKGMKQCGIDYDQWAALEGKEPCGVGVVTYTSYLISCDAGEGWAGEGALIVANSKPTPKSL